MPELCLDLPIEVTGFVVGKNGSTIGKIRESSHATVSLSANTLPENKKLKRITILGSDTQAMHAQDQVVGLLIRWCEFEHPNFDLLPEKTKRIVVASKSKRSQQITSELLIPRSCIRFVAGENYDYFSRIEQSVGAKIFPVEALADDNPKMVRIAIVGNEQAILSVRSSICQVAFSFLSYKTDINFSPDIIFCASHFPARSQMDRTC
jgi:hypothetical protein